MNEVGRSESKGSTQVAEQLDYLVNSIEQLDKALFELQSRLELVLRPFDDSGAKFDTPNEVRIVPLAETIKGQTFSIKGFIGRINSILDRLEL